MSHPTDWSRGYPVSEPYPASWHSFQSPAHLRMVCALMGVAWEVGPETPISIAEIGCGSGYTACMLAAGNPNAQVVGLDYNPAHIAEARSLAAAAGLTNVQFLEVDLADMSDDDLDRLPAFDLVTAHGLWSWVADPVRDGVLRLLRRRLKAGGVAMVSYNALPGAGGALGLARLARGTLRRSGSSVHGVAQVKQLVDRLVAAEALQLPNTSWRRVFTNHAVVKQPDYVMHEFLTEHWRPAFFADVAEAMATARCEYVGSATVDENFPQLTLSPEQRVLWNEAPDTASRELIKDLCVPRAFRRDVFVRGLRRVSRDAAVDALWVTLATHETGAAQLETQAGSAEVPQPLLDAVRAALAQGPQSIAALRALPGCGHVASTELLTILVSSGTVLPLWQHPGSGAQWEQAVGVARRFNAVAFARLAPLGTAAARLGLATPALGGGLTATALELAVAAGLAEAPSGDQDGVIAGAHAAADIVRRLLPPGTGPAADVVEELERQVAGLLRERLPVWRVLGIR